MGLHNVDIGAALRRLADRRIEEAMQEGKFDNLPGAGKPLNLEPMPAEENARLTWWALRILKNNDYTPEEIRWRKAIEYSKDLLANAKTEQDVVKLCGQVNDLVKKLNTLGTNAINAGVAGVDEAQEIAKFRARSGSR